jgi:hypothetical protein
VPLADAREAAHAVHARKPHVEEDEVRVEPAHERQDVRAGMRLSDDGKSLVLLEHGANTRHDQGMVVGYENAHAFAVFTRPAMGMTLFLQRSEGTRPPGRRVLTFGFGVERTENTSESVPKVV